MTTQRVERIPPLPDRSPDGHKGLYGSILIIAGSRGMAGAAALAGVSTLRSGAGLVRIATSAEVLPTVAGFNPCYMTHPLPCDAEGMIDFKASREALERLAEQADVLAVGPGLGRSEGIRALVRWAAESAGKPLVLDADGLNALIGDLSPLDRLSQPTILTPHPGEFARLVGASTAEVQADRENQAVGLASRSDRLVVVLKGNGTIVTDGSRLHVNATGNPGMATGGAGDILTGVIAALLGQRLAAFEAAALGVLVHGLAGDLARADLGEIGMTAADIAEALPRAFLADRDIR